MGHEVLENLLGAYGGFDLKEIKLTKGYVTIVDDEDYERLKKYSWFAHVSKSPDGSVKRVYAHTRIQGRLKPMHHFIAVSSCEIDHIDGDALNNRRENLRSATTSTNQANRKVVTIIRGKQQSSIFKGVSFKNQRNTWQCRIAVHGRRISRHFKNEIEAAKAYNDFALKYFGEYARLNTIPSETSIAA